MIQTSLLLLLLLPRCSSYSAERLQRVLARRRGGLTVVLENVRKENVALVARTAEGLGIATMHLIYTDDAPSVTHTRSFGALSEGARAASLSALSRGAIDWLDVRTHASAADCVTALRACDDAPLLVATAPPHDDGTRSLYDDGGAHGGGGSGGGGDDGGGDDGDWATRPCALCFGSEARGLSPTLHDATGVRVSVPMRGAVESFNVAVCASIVLGEVRKWLDRVSRRGRTRTSGDRFFAGAADSRVDSSPSCCATRSRGGARRPARTSGSPPRNVRASRWCRRVGSLSARQRGLIRKTDPEDTTRAASRACVVPRKREESPSSLKAQIASLPGR